MGSDGTVHTRRKMLNRGIRLTHLGVIESLGMDPNRDKPNCHRCGLPKTEVACLETLAWAAGLISSRVKNAEASRVAAGDRRNALQPRRIRSQLKSLVHSRSKKA